MPMIGVGNFTADSLAELKKTIEQLKTAPSPVILASVVEQHSRQIEQLAKAFDELEKRIEDRTRFT